MKIVHTKNYKYKNAIFNIPDNDRYNGIYKEILDRIIVQANIARTTFDKPIATHFVLHLKKEVKISEVMKFIHESYAIEKGTRKATNCFKPLYVWVRENTKDEEDNDQPHVHVTLFIDNAKARFSSVRTILLRLKLGKIAVGKNKDKRRYRDIKRRINGYGLQQKNHKTGLQYHDLKDNHGLDGMVFHFAYVAKVMTKDDLNYLRIWGSN